MKFLLLTLSLCFTSAFASEKDYLENRCDVKRIETFQKTLDLMEERGATCLVETGTQRLGYSCRNDGCSTAIFADWARDHGALFYSVDTNREAIEKVQRLLKSESIKNQVSFSHVGLVCSDSVPFLRNFGQQIDMLYLDSFDIDCQNPWPSQRHHLKEIIAALPWITENTVILIDDCGLPHRGKGGMAIEFLEKRGWVIIAEEHQALLVHESTLSHEERATDEHQEN